MADAPVGMGVVDGRKAVPPCQLLDVLILRHHADRRKFLPRHSLERALDERPSLERACELIFPEAARVSRRHHKTPKARPCVFHGIPSHFPVILYKTVYPFL